jgi:DNA replication protein DnaC
MSNDFNDNMRDASWRMFNGGEKRTQRVMSKATMDMCNIPAQFYEYDPGYRPLITKTLGLDTWLSEKISPEIPETVEFIKNYIINIAKVNKTGYGLTMQGPNGTGKTMIACAMAYEWMKLFPIPGDGGKHHALFMTLAELRRWMDLRKSFNPDDKSQYNEIKYDLEHRGFLIVDDVVNLFKPDEFMERETFVRLLKTRSEAGLINVVIMNMQLPDFVEAFGKTLSDILQAKGKILKVEGRIRTYAPPPPWEA